MKSRARTLLRRRHRIAQWQPSLWLIVGALAAEIVLLRMEADAKIRLGSALAFTAAALFTRFFRRPTLRATARQLDRTEGAHNRFEALAELNSHHTALANAQATSVDSLLAQRRPALPYGWIAGWIALLALSGTMLTSPSQPAAATPQAAATTSPQAERPSPPPSVSISKIQWINPPLETTALPDEEVPLQAEAHTPSGLRNLTLHVTINGEPRQPIPLTTTAAPGKNEISVSLPLKGLDALAYDLIAYSLSAEDEAKAPGQATVTSPLQFIQVVPQAKEGDGGKADPEQLRVAMLVRQQRIDQTQILRELSLLRHATSTPDAMQTAARAENAVQEATAQLATEKIPRPARTALIEATEAAKQATSELAAGNLANALPYAGRALTQLALAENVLIQPVIADGAEETPVPVPIIASGALPPRDSTPIGRLEKAAAEQNALATELTAQGPGPDTHTLQTRLARRIAELQKESALATVDKKIADAATNAQTAGQKLEQEDAPAAFEPASQAAQSLADAVAQLEEESRQRAVKTLGDVQRALIEEASRTSFPFKTAPEEPPDRAQKSSDGGLGVAAQSEQQNGSAAAAEELSRLSKAVQEIKKTAGQPDSESLMRVAQQAADARRRLRPREESLQEAQEELRRVQAGVRRPGNTSEQLRGLYQRSAAAGQSLTESGSRERQQAPNVGIPPPPPGGAGPAPARLESYARELERRVSGLLELVADQLREARRTHVLTTANPAEAPPAYRAAVADYFEALAKGSQPSSP